MTDQRLAGLSHQELWNLAHGGDPAAATTSQVSFARTAQVLESISKTLNAPLGELGPGWQGQAADAARGGIGQHARWAEAAAGRADTAAGQAGQQAASARTVIAEMPPPPSGPPAAGANWAQVEEAQANARQRALELMRGHAEECARTRPTETFTRPPTAGTTTGTAGTGVGRTTGRAGAAAVERAPSTNPTAAGRGVPGSAGGGGRTVSRAGLAEAPRSAGVTRGPAAAGTGTRPASVEPYEPGPGGQLRGGSPGFGAAAVGSEPGQVAGFRGPRGGQLWSGAPGGGGPGRSERVAPVSEAVRAGPGPGAVLEGPTSLDQRSGKGQRPRGGSELRPRGGPTTNPAGGGAGTHDSTATHGPAQPGIDPSMMPPLLGGAGLRDTEREQHDRLDYLLDEHDIFAENEWVAPPVIGS
jgi:hypothetical protein